MAITEITLKRNNSGTYDDLYPTTNWNQINDKPTTFTPTAHTHVVDDVVGLSSQLSTIKINSIYYVVGNTTGTAGTWTGTISDLSAYYDGLTIAYKIGIAGASTTTLNLNSLGAKTVRRNSDGNLTTHLPVNTVVHLTYTTISGTSYWIWADYSDAGDYIQRWVYSAVAGAYINDFKIVMEGTNGKFYPLTLDQGTGTTKVVSTANFKAGGQILLYNSSTDVAVDGAFSMYSLWEMGYSSNLHYTANQSSGFTVNMPLYLKMVPQPDGSFKLDNTSYTSWLTQTLPTTDDGFVYVHLGMKHNDTTTTFTLTETHNMLQYKDGVLRPYIPNHAHTSSEISDLKDQLKTLYIYGKAQSSITKGQAVQFAGVQGDHVLIKPAVPSEINANPSYFIGLAESTLATNDFGYIITQGELVGVDTDTNFAIGDIVWFASAGSTAGALTNVMPNNGYAKIQVAAVTKENVASGIMQVRVTIISRKVDEIIASGTASASTFLRGDGSWTTVSDTNTTYTFASGTTNGAFSVTPSGGSAQSVAIYGLGSAAYTASTAYAASSHTHGNIGTGGAMTDTASAVATGDALVVRAVGSNLAQSKTVQFDTTNSVAYLRKDGTWVSPPVLSHTHGNISNTGAIGTTSGLPIITTTSGVLTTGSFGTTSGTFTQGNDTRFPLVSKLISSVGVSNTSYIDSGLTLTLEPASYYQITLTGSWGRIPDTTGSALKVSIVMHDNGNTNALTGGPTHYGSFSFGSLDSSSTPTIKVIQGTASYTAGGTYTTMQTATATTNVLASPLHGSFTVYTGTSTTKIFKIRLAATNTAEIGGIGINGVTSMTAIKVG